MIEYKHLLGREFIWKEQDCYSLLRSFYKDNFNIDLPDYDRPENFWDKGHDLYMDHYYENGFRVLDVHPTQWQVGDVFLMAVNSPTANHAAILVENNQILHHMYGQLSKVEFLRGAYRDMTLNIFRHKDVKITKASATEEILDYLPESLRQKITNARNPQVVPEQ